MAGKQNPMLLIDFINGGANKKDGFVYKTAIRDAQRCLAKLKAIMAERSDLIDRGEAGSFSAADEIRKYKELLDDGVIAQEEFDAKKQQLLGL